MYESAQSIVPLSWSVVYGIFRQLPCASLVPSDDAGVHWLMSVLYSSLPGTAALATEEASIAADQPSNATIRKNAATKEMGL